MRLYSHKQFEIADEDLVWELEDREPEAFADIAPASPRAGKPWGRALLAALAAAALVAVVIVHLAPRSEPHPHTPEREAQVRPHLAATVVTAKPTVPAPRPAAKPRPKHRAAKPHPAAASHPISAPPSSAPTQSPPPATRPASPPPASGGGEFTFEG